MGTVSVRTFDTGVLQDALKSPSIALMKLSIEIDRQLRLLLGAVGGLSSYRTFNPVTAMNLLAGISGVVLPDALKNSVTDFWNVRNSVVHGGEAGYDGLAIRAIDYGLRILSILASIPRPKRVVRYVDVALYADKDCLRQYPNVFGVILESFAADGTSHGLKIHPSTLRYAVGEEVTWEWKLDDRDHGWDETWYRNPAKNGAIELAWSGSMEFCGRPLSAV
jgi:hypothetical protein